MRSAYRQGAGAGLLDASPDVRPRPRTSVKTQRVVRRPGLPGGFDERHRTKECKCVHYYNARVQHFCVAQMSCSQTVYMPIS